MTPLSFSVTRGSLPYQETYLPLLGLRWRHELPDRVEDNLKLGVVFRLDIPNSVPVVPIVQALRSVQVVHRIGNQPNKGPHDFDIDLDHALATQDA